MSPRPPLGRRAARSAASLLLALLPLLACDGVERRDGAQAERPEPGAYAHRLLFLGGRADSPYAAVFVMTAQQDRSVLQRTARGWLGEPDGWQPVLSASWQMQPMREPWRPVPHGPLRLVAGEGAPVSTVIRRDTAELRLRPGPLIGEWREGEPEVALRNATLEEAGEAVEGTLLEERTDGGIAGPAARAFLTDGQDLRLVLLEGGLWVQEADEERVLREVQLAAGPDGGWSFAGPDGSVAGELSRVGGADSEPGPDGLVLASGWVGLDRDRRVVWGMVRRDRE